MNRLGHQAAAQSTWLTYCAYLQHAGTPLDWQEIACGCVVASSMCADDWSPDVDQRGWLAKLIPGGHRGPTHMPEVVLAALWLVHHFLGGRGYDWFSLAAAAGWGSHLAADFFFGRIPFLVLGGRRVGFTFDTGGFVERVVTWLLAVACVPLAWWALGSPAPAGLLR